MPHKLRKIRKTRGSRTQGYGRIGQHRDAGSKGNRKVGRHKHLWSKVVAYEPDYFGNHGFTSPRSLNKIENTINLQKLVEIVETNTVDLTEMGYTKLLGTGKITKALTVTVPACSKLAEEKVVKAGGKVITASQATGE
jgi:large subunit ribosomal protein L15